MQIINIDEKLFVLFICKQRQYLTSLMMLLPPTLSADSSEKSETFLMEKSQGFECQSAIQSLSHLIINL